MLTSSKILEAIKKGLVLQVEKYFKEHPSDKHAFLKTEFHGTPPLHIAILNGHYHVAELLMREGANINQASTPDGLTAFHMVGMQIHPSVADLFTGKPFDKNAKTQQGDTALDIAIYQAIKEQSPRYNAVILKLASMGVKTNYYNPENLLPLLMIAANRNDVKLLVGLKPWLEREWPVEGKKIYYKMIKETGSNILLGTAVQNLAIESVRFMLSTCKVSPTFVSPHESSGLLFSFQPQSISNYFHTLAKAMPPSELFMLPKLLQMSGQSVVDSFDSKKVEEIQKMLELYGNMKLFLPRYGQKVELLSFECESGVLIEFEEDGTVKDQMDLLDKIDQMIKLLLNAGLDINALDEEGLTPSHYLLGAPVVVLERFVKHGMFFRVEDLHEAIKRHHPDVVKYMLNLGVSVEQKVNGKDALACLHGALADNLKLHESEAEIFKLIKSKMGDLENVTSPTMV